MRKNLVRCSDGTGNSGGKGRGTNVWKVYLAIDRHDHEADGPAKPPQIAFYDDGVGTPELRLPKVIGVYTSLARTYQPGDALYLFGFSRGAYTVRSLAGMIADIGVIDARTVHPADALGRHVTRAYTAYRATPRAGRHPLRAFAAQCRRDGVTLHDAAIRFIGVWDTVDAIGVPWDPLRDLIYGLSFLRRSHVHDLTPKIQHACHALAIDDERATFARRGRGP